MTDETTIPQPVHYLPRQEPSLPTPAWQTSSTTRSSDRVSKGGQAAGARTSRSAYRTEHDCIGGLDVPQQAYWGIHTQRALENFQISGVSDSDHPQLITALAAVKEACARANAELGLLSRQKARLIIAACREIEHGFLSDQFPLDVLQGGAGTSSNMNMNEVVANRALELGGYSRGDYQVIHPNDHVNMSQSTNDTYPAACKLALIWENDILQESCRSLGKAFHRLADRHANDVTLGRTQLQDAVPMTFGQEFHAFASFLKADCAAMDTVQSQLSILNLGATAIGTGICADLRFRHQATEDLSSITSLPLRSAPDPIAATTDTSTFLVQSCTLRTLAMHLKKAADDLRLLNSGPRNGFNELDVPALQAGSSIMPGKVNPVIAEAVNQSCFRIFGMDETVTWAASEGQLQLNAFEPVIIHELLRGMDLLTRTMNMFREKCVEGIKVNAKLGMACAESSPSISAALNMSLGYEKAVSIAQEAMACGQSVRLVAGRESDLPADKLDEMLDPIILSRRLGQTCREHSQGDE